jgi:phage shock protein PspC (stress-responsive transcriptional regulator)
MRRLCKSSHNRVFSGVCGGIGEHLNVDPILIRIAWVIFGLTLVGIIVYFVVAASIPYDYEV